MAKKVLTIIVSDLSGDETNDGETVEFTYRGVSYAIDLTQEESAAFDEAMEPYTVHARRQGGRRSRGAGTIRTDTDRLQAIREWGRSTGHKVSDRGRISQQLQDAYDAEH